MQERYINLVYMNTELLLPLSPDAAENIKCGKKFQQASWSADTLPQKSWVFHWLKIQLYKLVEENPLAIKAMIDSVSPWVQISGCWNSLPKH